jgi:hypothetical protein
VVIAHFIARSPISNMAAAAILKFDLHFRFCDFQTEHVFLSLCTNLHKYRVVIAHFIARSSISNIAAATILKAVGHFRCCIFDYGWKTRNCSSNFIGIGRKLIELLQFEFFHNGGCRHLGLDDR